MNCFDILKKTRGDELWLSGIEYEGLYLDYYENGQLWEKSYWKDYERHGECLRHWSDGQLNEKSYWKDGYIHGEYLDYYSNGQLHEKSYWKDGEKITGEEYNENR